MITRHRRPFCESHDVTSAAAAAAAAPGITSQQQFVNKAELNPTTSRSLWAHQKLFCEVNINDW